MKEIAFLICELCIFLTLLSVADISHGFRNMI